MIIKINDKDSNNPIKEIQLEKELSEAEIKKKYENAIKLLWASKYQEAQRELKIKTYNPKDLMPEIHNINFSRLIAQKILRKL